MPYTTKGIDIDTRYSCACRLCGTKYIGKSHPNNQQWAVVSFPGDCYTICPECLQAICLNKPFKRI
jgi:hypothetical protein